MDIICPTLLSLIHISTNAMNPLLAKNMLQKSRHILLELLSNSQREATYGFLSLMSRFFSGVFLSTFLVLQTPIVVITITKQADMKNENYFEGVSKSLQFSKFITENKMNYKEFSRSTIIRKLQMSIYLSMSTMCTLLPRCKNINSSRLTPPMTNRTDIRFMKFSLILSSIYSD
ncbi:hypothetical protein FGO68_gene6816 [Halteria grandinella]|uniref:Uncharacterized protein n=1 Tax=Halteria grandinella TaxID=5974 RepID=A0A8J8NAZ1_HALGN|nr:hypothetical protein FGO68_gene6816 [Halteria grandinella]